VINNSQFSKYLGYGLASICAIGAGIVVYSAGGIFMITQFSAIAIGGLALTGGIMFYKSWEISSKQIKKLKEKISEMEFCLDMVKA
jgi:hypothetical protein